MPFGDRAGPPPKEARGSRSSRCASATTPNRCSTGSRSPSSPGGRWPWSAPPAAGKSTRRPCSSGWWTPTRRRISVDGVDLRELRAGALADVAALVPQQAFLFDDTVRENVTLGAAVTDDDIWAALRTVQADGFVSALPEASTPGSESGAPRSPVASGSGSALARALVAPAAAAGHGRRHVRGRPRSRGADPCGPRRAHVGRHRPRGGLSQGHDRPRRRGGLPVRRAGWPTRARMPSCWPDPRVRHLVDAYDRAGPSRGRSNGERPGAHCRRPVAAPRSGPREWHERVERRERAGADDHPPRHLAVPGDQGRPRLHDAARGAQHRRRPVVPIVIQVASRLRTRRGGAIESRAAMMALDRGGAHPHPAAASAYPCACASSPGERGLPSCGSRRSGTSTTCRCSPRTPNAAACSSPGSRPTSTRCRVPAVHRHLHGHQRRPDARRHRGDVCYSWQLTLVVLVCFLPLSSAFAVRPAPARAYDTFGARSARCWPSSPSPWSGPPWSIARNRGRTQRASRPGIDTNLRANVRAPGLVAVTFASAGWPAAGQRWRDHRRGPARRRRRTCRWAPCSRSPSWSACSSGRCRWPPRCSPTRRTRSRAGAGSSASSTPRPTSSTPDRPARRCRSGLLGVEFDRVRFAYPGGPTCCTTSPSRSRRAKVAVVGETGSGKTTIAKLLTRLMDPPWAR